MLPASTAPRPSVRDHGAHFAPDGRQAVTRRFREGVPRSLADTGHCWRDHAVVAPLYGSPGRLGFKVTPTSPSIQAGPDYVEGVWRKALSLRREWVSRPPCASSHAATPAMIDDSQLSFSLPSVFAQERHSRVWWWPAARLRISATSPLRSPFSLPTDAIYRTSGTWLPMHCEPVCWRSAAAIPMATTSTGCAATPPASRRAAACPTAAGDPCSQPTISR